MKNFTAFSQLKRLIVASAFSVLIVACGGEAVTEEPMEDNLSSVLNGEDASEANSASTPKDEKLDQKKNETLTVAEQDEPALSSSPESQTVSETDPDQEHTTSTTVIDGSETDVQDEDETVASDQQACQIAFSWEMPTSPDVVAYYVYLGSQLGIFDEKIYVGDTTSYVLEDHDGSDVYFTVAAVDSNGNETLLPQVQAESSFY